MNSKLENNEGRPILDAVALRSLGIKRISELSGNIWTDYNAADPGITLMEILCFSIMDIGYRMTFDIRDLLTEKGQKHPRYKNVFHEPYQVLSSDPLTIRDYRKLVLENVKGVKNVWLKPCCKSFPIPEGICPAREISVKGYYDVFVDADAEDKEVRDAVAMEVKSLLGRHRNLCEDFNEPQAVEHLPVAVEADVEVEAGYDYKNILQQIVADLRQYVSPKLQRYTMDEMLKKGMSVAEIFTGPYPKWGYVNVDEVEDMEDNRELYASDMINIIMKIPGVKGIRHFKFVVKDTTNVDVTAYKISLKDKTCGKYVFRLAAPDDIELHTNIDFLLESFRFSAPYVRPQEKENENEVVFNGHLGVDISTNRNSDDYYTIQNEFPSAYLVGNENISDDETDLRKAQRLQLKGYLTFFDQLLSDFLMRIDNAKYMLSWEKTKNIEEWKQKQLASLHRILSSDDIDDLDRVVNDEYATYFQDRVFDTNRELQHKNKALDSLLARFNEDFVNFAVMQYISQSTVMDELAEGKLEYELIDSKSAMLEHYPVLGYRRAGAIDYNAPLSLNENASDGDFDDGNYYAVERKLAIKFGNLNYAPDKILCPEYTNENNIYTFTDNRGSELSEAFGVHVFEHTLLVPDKGVNKDNFLYQYVDEHRIECVSDPYSMKVTVVMPGWLNIVQDHRFRDVVEQTIVEEFPAHIAVKICWINPLQMLELEKSYKFFLQCKREKSSKLQDALNIFAQKLSKLNNIYHNACTKGAERKSVIGYTTLLGKTYQWKQ